MDKRLTAIANCAALTLIDPQPIPAIADIGTDHGKLAVWLAKNHGCTVYACDIASGPLSACQQLVDISGVADKVVPILCDGLSQIPSHVGTIVIAGLSGETIAGIIEKSPFSLSGKTLVLSPHSHEARLLGYLDDSGFVTLQRETVHSKSKSYIILMVRKP